MVVDAAFLAGTVASFMMNGACCMYQVSREDELREELREEIRREWYNQRKREIHKQNLTAIEHRKSFEDRYQGLLMRQDDQSYTHTHKFFAKTSPPRRDPAAQLMLSRSSSVLDEEDEDEDEDEEMLMLAAAAAGSDGTMEDVSIS